jgi:hypothetical protein
VIVKDLKNIALDKAHTKVNEIEKMADKNGLGGIFDIAVNIAESKTNFDIDGDGDVGKMGK